MNNLAQIKYLLSVGLDSVAVKLMMKDIHDILENTPLKSTHTRKGNIRLVLNKKTQIILDIVSTGITTKPVKSKTSRHAKHSTEHEFHKYEDLNPYQLWLLTYIHIPKLVRMEEKS